MASSRETVPTSRPAPPPESRRLLSDLRQFVLVRPAVPTLVRCSSEDERRNYEQRIAQRLGIRVDEYGILNIHRIGIAAPVQYVFRELLEWDAGCAFWPNHLAAVERRDGGLEHVRVHLLGRVGRKTGRLGLEKPPLFEMTALELREAPALGDVDSARYLLYRCTGGYPIGIFAIYVRSSIPAQSEREQTQVFFIVSFNPHGRKEWSRRHLVTRMWERIHNRVTSNVLNRFKRLCEWRFEEMREARAIPIS